MQVPDSLNLNTSLVLYAYQLDRDEEGGRLGEMALRSGFLEVPEVGA
jgi:hypothetical protein